MTRPGLRTARPWGRRADVQPTSPAAVLLASAAGSISAEAVRVASAAAGGGPVAVLVILRIHGYAFGVPNPGLLPTRKERDIAAATVSETISALSRYGVSADGQVAATRGAAKTIARVARARSARVVVMDASTGGRLRRYVEGDPCVGVRRRLDHKVEVLVV